jgi:cytochrome c oxidase accessory protein FixG
MCPWPRIQAALVDKETLTVTYRSERGDPRGAHKKGDIWEGRGDCIDCKQCVVVCPMGIDIRNGPQLECIQCGLCIDACDVVMKKIDRPAGLIAYDTDENVIRRWMKQSAAPFRAIRPRTALYAAVFAITGAIMIYGLATRTTLEFSALKERSLPYVELASGQVRNAYTLKVVNKARFERSLTLKVEGIPDAGIEIVGDGQGKGAAHVTAGPDSVDRYRLLITASRGAVFGNSTIRLILSDAGGSVAEATTHFLAPEQ